MKEKAEKEESVKLMEKEQLRNEDSSGKGHHRDHMSRFKKEVVKGVQYFRMTIMEYWKLVTRFSL